jgi:hypothetical protein
MRRAEGGDAAGGPRKGGRRKAEGRTQGSSNDECRMTNDEGMKKQESDM